MLDTTTYRKLFSRVGFCFFALISLTCLSQTAFSALFYWLAPQAVQAPWFIWVANYVPMYCIAVPLFFWLLHKLLPQNSPAPKLFDLNALQALIYLVLSFGTLYIFNLATGLITLFIGAISGSPVINPVLEVQQGSGMLWNFVFGCLVAPIGEELIFRKALYHKLSVLGDRCYILTGALLFGLFHGNVSQLLYAFAVGALFCYIYARTGRVLYPILLHILVNMVGMLLAPLALQSETLLMLMGMAVLACIASSIAIVILFYRKVQFTPPPIALPAHPVRTALLAPGMVFYVFLCVALIVAVLLAPLWLAGVP